VALPLGIDQEKTCRSPQQADFVLPSVNDGLIQSLFNLRNKLLVFVLKRFYLSGCCMKSYAAFFCSTLTLAQRARCAAPIFFRAD
jgi:hypothetical protein